MAGTTTWKQSAPFSTFISLQVGNMQLGNVELVRGHRDSRVIQSFKITRLSLTDVTDENDANFAGGVDFLTRRTLYSQAEFGLSTVLYNKLESKLLNYIKKNPKNAKVSFRYGYVNGIKSYRYTGIISSLKLSDDMYTLYMTVTYDDLDSKYTNFIKETINVIGSKKYNKYSDLITDICKLQKWNIGRITPTKDVDPTSIIKPTIQDTPLNYIDKLRKLSVSENNEGSYRSEFRFNRYGDVCYYFIPSSFLASGDYRICKDFNFYYNLLPNGQVINFKPVLTDGVAYYGKVKTDGNSSSGEDSNIYGVVTNDTKEMVTVSYKVGSKSSGPGIINASGKIAATTKRGVHMNAQYTDVSKYAESIMKDDISKFAFDVNMNPRATMDILGDPELQLLDYINVIPMYPAKSRSSGGIMHPSGGTYRIIQLIDSINSGVYTTSMNLVKENNTKKLSDLDSGPYRKSQPEPEPESKKPKEYKVGDTVTFTGNTHYVSSYPGSKGYRAACSGTAHIAHINYKVMDTPGAHPYNLIHDGKFSNDNNLYGWVDIGTFS